MSFSYLCPHCGKHYASPGLCPVCRVDLLPQQMPDAPKFCTNCGAPVGMPGQPYCTSCGAPLLPRRPSPAPQQAAFSYVPTVSPVPQTGKRKFPVWGIVAIVLAAVALTGAVVLVALSAAGVLSPGSGSGSWYQNNGGYHSRPGSSAPYEQTGAKAIITAIKYGTGEELQLEPQNGEFVKVALNIINTRDQSISLGYESFFLTDDETGEKIFARTDDPADNELSISAGKMVSGVLTFSIDPDASYHFNFTEPDGTLISSYELSK